MPSTGPDRFNKENVLVYLWVTLMLNAQRYIKSYAISKCNVVFLHQRKMDQLLDVPFLCLIVFKHATDCWSCFSHFNHPGCVLQSTSMENVLVSFAVIGLLKVIASRIDNLVKKREKVSETE